MFANHSFFHHIVVKIIDMITKLPTWGAWKNKSKQYDGKNDWRKSSEFCYEGTVNEGTIIYFGSHENGKFKNRPIFISNEEYQKLLQEFKGKNEPIILGTSHDKPPKESVGYWLIQNVFDAKGTATASYVGPILLHEMYAIKGEDPATIEFL